MKKIISILLIIFIVSALSFSLISCDNPISGSSSPSVGIKDETTDTTGHYLVFTVNGEKIASMYVFEDDTYETLEPYFPKVANKEITSGSDTWVATGWKKVDKVYDPNQRVIYIEAVLIKE